MTINNFGLIVGSMKSGTTSLFNYLSQHPQIAGARRKEPNFFSYDDRWEQGWQWYLKEWEDWNPDIHKIALEATINYTKYPVYPNAAERIYQLKDRANFKFVYVLRNPIERIESQYTYDLSSIYRADSVKKISAEDLDLDREILETSRYAKQLKEYCRFFPRKSILLIDFATFKRDNLQVLQEICRFFEVDANYQFQDLNVVHNPTKNRIIDDNLWRSFRKIKPLRKMVNRTITKDTKTKLHGLFGTKVEHNFRLSSKQKKFVLTELEEDLLSLSNDYGFDISNWGIDA